MVGSRPIVQGERLLLLLNGSQVQRHRSTTYLDDRVDKSVHCPTRPKTPCLPTPYCNGQWAFRLPIREIEFLFFQQHHRFIIPMFDVCWFRFYHGVLLASRSTTCTKPSSVSEVESCLVSFCVALSCVESGTRIDFTKHRSRSSPVITYHSTERSGKT